MAMHERKRKAPARRARRNDLCPCASGKKYKHCCLAEEQRRSESPGELAWKRLRRAIDGLPDTLADFAADAYGLDVIEEAWDEFMLWEGGAFDPDSPLTPLFVSWLHHSWKPDPWEDEYAIDAALRRRTPTSVFLARHAARLDPLTRRYLEACLAAPFSFFEVLRCDPGHGFRARDVITGEEHEVLERVDGEPLERGDIVFAQLVPIDGIVVAEASWPFALLPAAKIAVIELREQIARSPQAEQHGGGPLHAWSIEIRELFLALIQPYLERRAPVLHNTDGELIELQRVVFDVDDAQRVLDALTRLPGFRCDEVERAEDGRLERAQLSWSKPGNRAQASWENTVLGHVAIETDRLVAGVSSAERARAFRAVVEQALPSEARYRDTEIVARDELDAELEGVDELGSFDDTVVDATADDFAQHPELREQVARLFERHYDDWVTQESPALGGRRPIDVVQEPNGREKVEALVIGIERDAARVNADAAAAVVARLRERLGLTRG
jgi:SEC-C motif-containing protein